MGMPDMRSGRCAVCGNPSQGPHVCRMTTDVGNVNDSWWNRVVRRLRYQAQIVAVDGSVIWGCDHRHETSEDAKLCAEAQLAKRQDPATPLEQLARPQMRRRGDQAGFHASVPGLSPNVWGEVIDVCRGACRYCGADGALEREHRVPISRGGENRIKNIVAACRTCNAAKASATEGEYLKELRRQWGDRVPRSPRNLDKRLAAIERRYASEIREEREETLLRSMQVPVRVWDGLPKPKSAVFAVHRQQTQKLAGVSFNSDAVERALRDKQSWEGRVVLVPQTNNVHDPQAVGIFRGGDLLGFLPAPVARAVHPDLLALLKRERTAVVTKLELFRWEHGHAGKTYVDLPLRTRPA